jgi:FtsZ-interacting cell division protein ZipA
MGKLLVLGAIIVVVAMLLGGWGLFLENRKERFSLGLRGSKKQIAALKTERSRYVAALEEIRSVAQTSAEPATRDPAFDYILDKAEQALRPERNR